MVSGTAEDPGIIPWGVADLFETLQATAPPAPESPNTGIPLVRESFVRMSYFQIGSGGQIKDLLDPEKRSPGMSVQADTATGVRSNFVFCAVELPRYSMVCSIVLICAGESIRDHRAGGGFS